MTHLYNRSEMRKKCLSFAVGCLLLVVATGCTLGDLEFNESQNVTGYVPVYGSVAAMDIAMTSPRAVEDPGKIYLYGKYLLVNEKKKGIHVFDNTNPQQPENLGFLQMLGNSDMAIKDGLLYADHMGNLVALTVNDFGTMEERGRLPLRNWNKGIPPPPGFHFECIDPEKGLVVNWISAELKNPRCYAIR